MNTAKPRKSSDIASAAFQQGPGSEREEYGDEGMEDLDFEKARMTVQPSLPFMMANSSAVGDLEYHDIDYYDDDIDLETQRNTRANKNARDETTIDRPSTQRSQLESGKWSCNHRCKDKSA